LCILGLPTFAQDVLTFHNDAARSGIQSAETKLTTSNVDSSMFGMTHTFPVDGDVYAQTLYVSNFTMSDGKAHNVIFVATEHDLVYAFDADGKNGSGGYLWKKSMLPAGETWVTGSDVGTTDIIPDIGITGTPVIDRAGGTLYVVAKSKTTSGTVVFRQRLHALNLADGTEKLNGPTLIAATLPGTGNGGSTVSFDAFRNNQRAALLLAPTPGGKSANAVFIAWASHGDNGTYHGWVISYNAANISQQTGAWVDTPNGSRGGIWMSAGGISTDGSGNFFVTIGNGTFDANSGGPDYGDSAVRLRPSSSGSGLTVSDWFTPVDQSSLSGQDLDFGTGGPLLLPTQSGSIPHLLATTDKGGRIYILNRDIMGHFSSTGNKDVQDFSIGSDHILSNLVFFNNSLYITPSGGPVESYAFDKSTEKFATSPSSTSSHFFGCSTCDGAGSNFSISANGTANGIVWAIDYSQYGKGPAVLYAYQASNLAIKLYDSTQNANDKGPTAIKFTSPTIANGSVFVGGRNAVVEYGANTTPPPTVRTISDSANFAVDGGFLFWNNNPNTEEWPLVTNNRYQQWTLNTDGTICNVGNGDSRTNNCLYDSNGILKDDGLPSAADHFTLVKDGAGTIKDDTTGRYMHSPSAKTGVVTMTSISSATVWNMLVPK
jgi:hypothetical protein